ncbi:TetR/AcrR family transcriptional regulator [Streptomyces sp. NPDC088197]|uniref:TetR/AcrR family transcriptional regulator n=1 Tax=unclassified Streptomyces TaxID=2593676 RepID=UPI0036ED0F5B
MTEGQPPAPRPERADAARNRRAILRATEELLAAHRPEEISMERVAEAAGVGKGTVFHRFGNRAGLMRALMEDRALALHEDVTSGPPPLGPGAPPRERLLAFLDAVSAVIARNKGLMAALGHAAAVAPRGGQCESEAEVGDAHPVYGFWHAHLSALLREARPDAPPAFDPGLLAHLLLSCFSGVPVLRLLESGEGERVAAGVRQLATALVDREEWT